MPGRGSGSSCTRLVSSHLLAGPLRLEGAKGSSRSSGHSLKSCAAWARAIPPVRATTCYGTRASHIQLESPRRTTWVKHLGRCDVAAEVGEWVG